MKEENSNLNSWFTGAVPDHGAVYKTGKEIEVKDYSDTPSSPSTKPLGEAVN